MTDIAPVLRGRWSPRSFDPDRTVTPDEVRLLVEAARWAPSALNKQPWRFLMAPRGDASRSRLEPMVAGYSDWALDAGLLVVNIYQSEHGDPDLALYDLGDAVAHMSIQAETLGLHVRQFATFDRAGVNREFGIDSPFTAVTMTAVGAPPSGLEPAGRDRVDIDEVIWRG